MNKKEFIAEIEKIVELEVGELNGDDALADLEDWDSLAVMGFIAMVDTNFGVTIEALKIRECTTVDDLVGLVGNRLS